MIRSIETLTLRVESPLASPHAANFRPSSWPLSDDFPVVIDANGVVVSRYGHDIWNLAAWAGKPCVINFRTSEKGSLKFDDRHVELLKQVVSWLIWGPGLVKKARTIAGDALLLKKVAASCANNNIELDQLSRFPEVIKSLALNLPESQSGRLVSLLNHLLLAKEWLGFVILDTPGLAVLARHLSIQGEKEQSAYVPPRIWTYQVNRLKACIDDYWGHREAIADLFEFCLSAYARAAGGDLSRWFSARLHRAHPFNQSAKLRKDKGIYCGSFYDVAKSFGVADLLERWIGFDEESDIRKFASYLSLISIVGIGYCINFSLMRRSEASSLGFGCLVEEEDALGEVVYSLRGATTKTIDDSDARWIVAPSVRTATQVLEHVARLRYSVAVMYPNSGIRKESIEDQVLWARPFEPWGCVRKSSKNQRALRDLPPYVVVQRLYPKLLDQSEMTIREDDIVVARELTEMLDKEAFAVGSVWPLSWHQLRRTGAVNMLQSSLVSEASLQYQLKHARRTMTRYYGQNYWKLGKFNRDAAGVFVQASIDVLARTAGRLADSGLVSPHGEKRTKQLCEPIASRTHEQLVAAGVRGDIHYHPTFLGACTNPTGPCEYGGIASVAKCMGFGEQRPCEFALLDVSVERVARVNALRESALAQREKAELGSPLASALTASLESMERYLDAARRK